MKNKHAIKIVYIKDMGRNHNQFCDQVLMLRTARKINDIEVVNNTVLSRLRNHSSVIKFEII